jgi:hypothetical protein
VLSGGTANVKFLSNGSGGLEIADSPDNISAPLPALCRASAGSITRTTRSSSI